MTESAQSETHSIQTHLHPMASFPNLLFCLVLLLSVSQSTICTDPEVDLDALGIILHWGYPGEEHTVVTEDGYVLTIQRIRGGKSGNQSLGAGKRPVMFMQHGLECSSTNWITNLPNQAAGFLFADAGFDVWLGNFRGNTYGKRHARLSPDSDEFWQFTWDQMARYDLEAMINYILKETGQEQLDYMGHSEGTMTAFAKFSTDVQFQKKVKRFFALGPVATVEHIQGGFRLLAPFTKVLSVFFKMVGIRQFLPHSWIITLLSKTICGWRTTNPLCDNILFLIAGPTKDMNETRVPVYISHTPAGTSTRNMVHFGQMVHSGKFQMYNFGSKTENRKHYGRTEPPCYNVSKVEVPTYLFWGDVDWLADKQDIQTSLIPKLPSLRGNFELPGFDHLDFIWGLKATDAVYRKILSIIKEADFPAV